MDGELGRHVVIAIDSALVLIGLIWLYAAIASWSEVFSKLPETSASRSALSRLLLVGLGVKASWRLLSIRRAVSGGLGVSLASIVAMLAAFIATHNPVLGVGAVMLVAYQFVATRAATLAELSVRRYVKNLGGVLHEVVVEVTSSEAVEVDVCDTVPESVAVLRGSPCARGTVSAGRALKLSYVAAVARPKAEVGPVKASVYVPLALLPRNVVVESKALLKVGHLSRAGITGRAPLKALIAEPYVDRVRPYEPGDELRLVIPKSVLAPGGPRTKVLSPSTEEAGTGPPTVGVVLSGYVCRYALGRAALLNILKLLKDSGVEHVLTGQGLVGVDELVEGIDSLCREGVSGVPEAPLLIAPPDMVSDLARARSLRVAVIIEPAIDRYLALAPGRGIQALVRGWVEGLREGVDRVEGLLRSRGVEVLRYGLA